MTAIIVDAPPFNPVIPYVQVGTAPDTVNFECAASDLEVSPDQDETTTTTFCGSYTTYKAETWTITATVYPSYGPDGLWARSVPSSGWSSPLRSARRKTIAVSETNPSMTGVGIIKAFGVLHGRDGRAEVVRSGDCGPGNAGVDLHARGVDALQARRRRRGGRGRRGRRGRHGRGSDERRRRRRDGYLRARPRVAEILQGTWTAPRPTRDIRPRRLSPRPAWERPHVSGRLAASVEAVRESKGARVSMSTPYAAWIEYGRFPGTSLRRGGSVSRRGVVRR